VNRIIDWRQKKAFAAIAVKKKKSSFQRQKHPFFMQSGNCTVKSQLMREKVVR
jgi:hypothetical protein